MNTRTAYVPTASDFVTPPGDTLLEMLEERQMTQAELARRMGRPPKTINGIIKGHKAITPETAIQLELVFGLPARFWLDREQDYREFLARQEADDALDDQLDWLDNFPIRSMIKRGILPDRKDKRALLAALLQRFGIAAPDNWSDIWKDCLVSYRKSQAYESNEYALSVWLREGELAAREIWCAPYDRAAFLTLLRDEIRPLTLEPPAVFRPRLSQLCAQVGVAVTLVPQIKGARVSGAARWLAPDKALIQLSLRYKKDDHFWFSFFHEAGHIIKHGKRQTFIETDKKKPDTEDKEEQEANQFAADMLIPPDELAAFVQDRAYFSRVDVEAFADHLGIAPGIVVGRLQHDDYMSFKNLNDLKNPMIWTDS